MNVAGRELCKELYELSGWDDMPKETSFEWFYSVGEEGWHLRGKRQFSSTAARTFHERNAMFPAYDLGYLLRKLPTSIPPYEDHDYNLYMEPGNEGTGVTWLFTYCDYMTNGYGEFHPKFTRTNLKAATPEDAACKLAIELFKQGVLKKRKGGESL